MMPLLLTDKFLVQRTSNIQRFVHCIVNALDRSLRTRACRCAVDILLPATPLTIESTSNHPSTRFRMAPKIVSRIAAYAAPCLPEWRLLVFIGAVNYTQGPSLYSGEAHTFPVRRRRIVET